MGRPEPSWWHWQMSRGLLKQVCVVQWDRMGASLIALAPTISYLPFQAWSANMDQLGLMPTRSLVQVQFEPLWLLGHTLRQENRSFPRKPPAAEIPPAPLHYQMGIKFGLGCPLQLDAVFQKIVTFTASVKTSAMKMEWFQLQTDSICFSRKYGQYESTLL